MAQSMAGQRKADLAPDREVIIKKPESSSLKVTEPDALKEFGPALCMLQALSQYRFDLTSR
jgi:hypothetical protein